MQIEKQLRAVVSLDSWREQVGVTTCTADCSNLKRDFMPPSAVLAIHF
jgi:hypothetical protein